MKRQFASTRKVMRIGKNIEHFKAASQVWDYPLLSGYIARKPLPSLFRTEREEKSKEAYLQIFI